MKTKYDIGQEVYFAPFKNVDYLQKGIIHKITFEVNKPLIYYIYVRDYVYHDVKEDEIIDDIEEIKSRLLREAKDSYERTKEQIEKL